MLSIFSFTIKLCQAKKVSVSRWYIFPQKSEASSQENFSDFENFVTISTILIYTAQKTEGKRYIRLRIFC